MYHGGDRLALVNVDDGDDDQGGADSEHADSDEKRKRKACFEWQGGEKRMTTGIWIWSKPFVRQAVDGTRVAVLLIDTQGMFDNETSMSLTACIFGLSTLLSSRLVYNVEKRVQEDHLQQLALFTEYGRMALSSQASAWNDNGTNNSSNVKPFQHVEFLVRDWQHFDDEQEDDITSMRKSMDDYIAQVVKERSVKDLQETRDQITTCFDKISCFGLCHPGIPVTKKNYDGSLASIDKTFLTLIDSYARYVFEETLEPNLVMGRTITAPELREHIVQYTGLFRDGARFPEAKTLLEATALANNYGAKSLSILVYKESMDSILGIGTRKAYISKDDFDIHARTSREKALAAFDGRATMGRDVAIKECRKELEEMIANEYVVYAEVSEWWCSGHALIYMCDVFCMGFSCCYIIIPYFWYFIVQVNAGRNPFRDVEYYAIPMGIAVVAFILRWIADTSCSSWSSTCKLTSEIMGHLYMAIFTVLLIISAGRIKGLYSHLRAFIPFQVDVPPCAVKNT